MKIYTQVSQVMNSLGDDYRYLFLTLTVPNCQGSDLAATVDALENAWRQLAVKSSHTAISKRFNSAVCGWFKALEVTHNTELYKFRYVKDENGKKHKRLIFDDDGQRIPNPFYDTYHPHFHVILAVKPSYFTRDYIKHDEWLDMWRTATGDITQGNMVSPRKGRMGSTSGTGCSVSCRMSPSKSAMNENGFCI